METTRNPLQRFRLWKKWVALFKRGREIVEDNPHSGHPVTATSEEIIEKIHDMMLNDRRLKVREISEVMRISTERARQILVNVLGMSKVSARWIPHLLTQEQKHVQCQISRDFLARFEKYMPDFFRQFVTTDETYIHYYISDTK